MDRREIIARNLRRLIDRENKRRIARGDKPWSNRALSNASSSSETVVRDLLECRVRSPRYETLEGLAAPLNATVDDIVKTAEERLADRVAVDLAELPEADQREAQAFIAFLKSRNRQAS